MTDDAQSRTQGTIVVGVDASEGARAALRWAVTEARLRNSRLRAVFAWTLSYPPGDGFGYLVGGPIEAAHYGGLSDQRRAAEEVLERATIDIAISEPDLVIEREVIEGPPGEVLVDEAAGADLLVVGSRGHGGFVGLLLGSVSQQCAHHALCPVVIVHPADERQDSRRGPGGRRAQNPAAALAALRAS
jgi:nucleotide-binding universal stress UspA family protein